MADNRFSLTLKKSAPEGLGGTRIGRLLGAIGMVLDQLLAALVDGVTIRFPGYTQFGTPELWDGPGLFWNKPGLKWSAPVSSDTSLHYVSRDRRIRRGRSEPDSVFAERVLPWWDDHKQRGNSAALLRQVRGYYYPQTFVMQTVGRSGIRHRMVEDGTITRDIIGYNPDARPDELFRLWVYYYDPEGFDRDGTWDDPGTWGDGGIWNFDMTVADADRARTVPREWLAGHVGEATLVIVHSGIPTEMRII